MLHDVGRFEQVKRYNTFIDMLSVSDAVMEQVREHHAVKREVMDSPAEHLIGHIALAVELVYSEIWKIAKEQGYIYRMFQFPTRNESTRLALEETRKELEKFYDEKNWN